MKKRMTMMTVVAAVLLLGGIALAQPGMMAGGMNGPGGMNQHGNADQQGGGMFLQRMLPMLQRLDLTDDQMEQVHEIMDNARQRIESIRESDDHEGMREQFKDLFTSSSISVIEVESLLNQRLDAMEEMNSIIAETVVEIHDVLTEEQLQAIAEFEPGEGGMHSGRQGEHAPMMHGGSGPGIHPNR